MAYWFDLTLKAISSIAIIYLMMIPVFKHHNVMNLIDLIASIAFILVLIIFIETTYYLVFGIVFGTSLIGYLGVRVLFKYRHEGHFVLFNLGKSDYEAMNLAIVETATQAQMPLESITYPDHFPYVYRVKINDRKAIHKFNKVLDDTIKKRFSYRFGTRYVIFLMIFIILALIWRY